MWSAPLAPRCRVSFLLLGALLLLGIVSPAWAVKEHDFKKCDQAGFCHRNRKFVDAATAYGSAWASPYSLLESSLSLSDGKFDGVLLKSLPDAEPVRFPVAVVFLQSGTVRVTVDEERRQTGDIELRHQSPARKERYNEAEELVIVGGLNTDANARIVKQDKSHMVVQHGPSSNLETHIRFSPFTIDFKRDGVTHVQLNDRGWMNLEHWRPKREKEKSESDKEVDEGMSSAGTAEAEDESTWWDESFRGNTDTKPRGPESIALDISFPGYDLVYGIPSHAGPLSLKETRGDNKDRNKYSDPYRLYNADVFEYILDSPMTLYGSIPVMQAHRKDSTVGVFWLNAAETWVDITKSEPGANPYALGSRAKTTTRTHWISESGVLDLFVFLGPSPQKISQAYGELTGYTAMPQEFALGYHQCRWNYMSDDDVKDVDRRMDMAKVPYDVIWLDIEYTDEKKYFTFNPDSFADPLGMGRQLDSHGRQLVIIIDPHIKNTGNYPVVDQLKSKELAVRNKDGNIFEGWCWPGSSYWIDTFNPASIEWWKSLFRYDTFRGTMENTWIWNDMNEPSVFNGPDTTMPKDNLHYGNWEHRDVHNLMGMTFHNATNQALVSRKSGERRRPFVLTRSFFAGSQRFGAMWTGDNQASWDHLGATVPMLLSQGIAGFPFAGADVGGFFGDPDKELLARWYQAGAFYPFFRAHAHIDSRRREPYLAEQPYRDVIIAALRLRYSLLPMWYTAFFHAHHDGSPILRPLFWTHPSHEEGFVVDDQYFVGSSGLLHKPVVAPDQKTVDIHIPDDEVYYDYFTYDVLPTKKGKSVTLDTPLDHNPLLMRGGHIIPRRDTPRRSSQLMRFDNYTLVVSVSRAGTAEGELYVDDGDSFDYEEGQYVYRRFSLQDGMLSNVDAENRDASVVLGGAKEWLQMAALNVHVERIVFVGAPASWRQKTMAEIRDADGSSRQVRLQYHAGATRSQAPYAVVSGVQAKIVSDWTLHVA